MRLSTKRWLLRLSAIVCVSLAGGCTSAGTSSTTTISTSTTASTTLDLQTAAALCEETGLEESDAATRSVAPEFTELMPTIVSNACNGRLTGEPGLAQLVVDDGSCSAEDAKKVLQIWWRLFWEYLFYGVDAGFDREDFAEPELDSLLGLCLT